MIRITLEDTEYNTSIIGQFTFDETKDGSAFDYIRKSADQIARQYFLTEVGTKLLLVSDKAV